MRLMIIYIKPLLEAVFNLFAFENSTVEQSGGYAAQESSEL